MVECPSCQSDNITVENNSFFCRSCSMAFTAETAARYQIDRTMVYNRSVRRGELIAITIVLSPVIVAILRHII